MKAYSPDLREKIIEALESGENTHPEIAENFIVSLSFVDKLWKRWRKTGSYEALPHTGGRKRTLRDIEQLIRQEVSKQSDATLSELCERVEQASGTKSRPSQMCRELKLLNLPLKKSQSTTASAKAKE